MSSDHLLPARADHRYIKKILQSIMGGKVEYIPGEFDRVSRVFSKVGGSWVRVFRGGSPQDIALLKRILRVAKEKGYITKKHNWGVGDDTVP